jgi:hypothetical protein
VQQHQQQRLVTCQATGTQPASAAAPDAAWSQNLLQLTKKKRKKSSGSSGPKEAEEVFFNSPQQQQQPWGSAAAAGAEDLDGPSTSGRMLDDDDTWEFDSDFDPSDNAGGKMIGEKKKLPAAVRCFDTARIYVKGGDGGAGCVAFRREPYVEKGGPNGGNGGKGGNVWVVAEEGLNSLLSFRNQSHFRGGNGYPGGSKEMSGMDLRVVLVVFVGLCAGSQQLVHMHVKATGCRLDVWSCVAAASAPSVRLQAEWPVELCQRHGRVCGGSVRAFCLVARMLIVSCTGHQAHLKNVGIRWGTVHVR